MRRSTPILNPLFTLTTYFVVLWLLVEGFVWALPAYAIYLPFGGVETLLDSAGDVEVLQTMVTPLAVENIEALTLALAILGAVLIMVPVSWVYFITTRTKQIDRSFAQTIMVLPVIVAGIAMIVQNSLALAFSLAGVVAAVRFRFSLEEPAHALYIFLAIAVGLGAGIGALGISYVVSLGFVYVNLLLWKLNFGSDLTTPFFSFLTGRGRNDNDL